MLCGPVTMKDTSCDPSLWCKSTSDSEVMYNACSTLGKERDTSSWDSEIKQRISRSAREGQARIPTTTKVTNQDRFNGSGNSNTPKGGLSTEIKETETERPQFHITIGKPIRRITPCNVDSFPLWPNPGTMHNGNERRASDGVLSSSLLSSKRNIAVFSTLTEEFCNNDSATGLKEADRYDIGVSSVNGRRFSDGCFRNVPIYNGNKKVSVVLPQPRRSASEELYSGREARDLEFDDSSQKEEEDHWKKLVAKAKGFKPSKAPFTNKSKGEDFGDIEVKISRSMAEVEDVCSDISSEASFSSNSSLSENDNADSCLQTVKPISGELGNYKSESLTNASSNTAKASRRVSMQPSFDSNLRGTHPRRASVATSNPERSCDPKKSTKLSGYSTQSALEQARQLLGRLQSEGKNKTKKERLEELSTALKWILEELNRIETPDRELVSLFISLRAKIVNLKTDLKAEEFYATPIDPTEEIESVSVMQNLAIDDGIENARSRRFSWC